jgi:hypothetical protein
VNVRAWTLALGCASVAWAQMNVSGSMPVTVLDTAPAAQSISALNGAATVALAGQQGAGVVLSGTWSATLTPELSFDGGSNWVATFFYLPNLGQVAATAAGNGSYTILCTGGASHARVRASAYTSGLVTAVLRAAPRAPGIVAIAGSDGRNLHPLATDSAGGLVAAGSTGVNISAAGTTVVKGSPGILRRVVVASGIANATVKLFNVGSSACAGTPASGVAGVITLHAQLDPFSLEVNQTFNAGICVVTSSAMNLIVIFD